MSQRSEEAGPRLPRQLSYWVCKLIRTGEGSGRFDHMRSANHLWSQTDALTDGVASGRLPVVRKKFDPSLSCLLLQAILVKQPAKNRRRFDMVCGRQLVSV